MVENAATLWLVGFGFFDKGLSQSDTAIAYDLTNGGLKALPGSIPDAYATAQ